MMRVGFASVLSLICIDSYWRNRAEFVQGREAIIAFLSRKWSRELDYRLIKELWGFREQPHGRALCLRMA